MKISYEEKIEGKKQSLKRKIHAFSLEYLDDDLEDLCFEVVEMMTQMDYVMFMQGKLKNWASAIVYLIAWENYMFQNRVYDRLDYEDIEEFFNSKSTFYCQLATRIDKKLGIRGNEKFRIKSKEDLDSRGSMYMDDEGNIWFIENSGFRWFIC